MAFFKPGNRIPNDRKVHQTEIGEVMDNQSKLLSEAERAVGRSRRMIERSHWQQRKKWPRLMTFHSIDQT